MDSHIDNIGMRKMMASLIDITLKDLKSKRPGRREEAIAWLFSLRDSAIDFKTACHVCELSADAMLDSLVKSGTITKKEVEKIKENSATPIDK